MGRRNFPENIPPTSRTYKPGKVPETVFEAQNGAVSIIQYGQNFVNAELTLGFTNVSDENVAQILDHYASVLNDDYVTFGKDRGLQGVAPDLSNTMETGKDNLQWRYKEAPEVQSVYPGISSVQLSFVGVLYGA